MPSKPTKPHPVLSDHKRQGKQLIPPFVAQIGMPQFSSWIDKVIPEVIWIALLHRYTDVAEGNDLAVELAHSAQEACSVTPLPLFNGVSAFASLKPDEQSRVRSKLSDVGRLRPTVKGLAPLLTLYPTCPLNFLATPDIDLADDANIEIMKQTLRTLFDKTTRESVMVQGAAIYVAFVLDRLKVVKTSVLSQLPELEKYPNTVLSHHIAGAVRCALYSMLGEKLQSSTWPDEFWNRGHELEPCSYA